LNLSIAHDIALSCGQLQLRLAQAGTLEDIVKKGDGVMTESCKKLEVGFGVIVGLVVSEVFVWPEKSTEAEGQEAGQPCEEPKPRFDDVEANMLTKLNNFSRQLREKIANRTHDGMACVHEGFKDLAELAMACYKAGLAWNHVEKLCETIGSSSSSTDSASAMSEAQGLNKDLVRVLSAPCRRAWVHVTTVLEKKKAAASSSDVKRLRVVML